MTVLVAASGASHEDLVRTVRSVDRQQNDVAVALAVTGDADSARRAAALAGERASLWATERGEALPQHFLEGRTQRGTPYLVKQLDAPPADALNDLMQETGPFTHVFVALRPGDELAPGALARLAAAFEDPQIGGVWADHFAGDLRVYEEPFDRNRLLEGPLREPGLAAVTRAALGAVGLFDPAAAGAEFYDLWLRVTERFVVAHVPDPLGRLAPRPAPDPAAAAAAKAAAVRRATHRAAHA